MTAALEVGEWSAARPGRILPPGKTRYPFCRRLGGPQGRSGLAEKLVPTGIRPRTVQPVAQSLYRLSYPAHTHTHTHTHVYIYIYIKVKDKSVPLQAWRGPEGSRKVRFPDFVTTAQDGSRLSALRTGRTLPPGKTRYPFYKRLGRPQVRSGGAENLVPTGIRPRTVQPVAQSLYRLSYPAHTHTHTHTHIYIYIYIRKR